MFRPSKSKAKAPTTPAPGEVIGADGGSKSKWKKMLIRSVAAVVMTAVFGGLVRRASDLP